MLEAMDINLPSHLYKYAPLRVRHTGPDGQTVTGLDAVEDILTRNRIYVGAITYGDSVETIELPQDGSTEATLHRIFRKAECWRYEHEYRVCKLPSSRTADAVHGNAHFNSELVDALYFGLRTPEPDVEKVLAIVAGAKHDIKVYRAQKNTRSLRLTFTPIAK